ncbi:MAG: cupredoxin domain-containing protein [Acidimicrobiales bacterium]
MTRLGVLMAAIALLAAACGGDSDPPDAAGGGGPGVSSTTSAGAAPTPAPAAATLELSAENIAFSVSTLAAEAGRVTISFDNLDEGTPHNLHVTGDGVDERTDIEPGPVTQRLALTLAPGTYRYVCDVHPQQMTGELTVE